MPSVRIEGVVKLANALRCELSRPVSPARKEQLRQLVADSMQQIGRILEKHGGTAESLPAQTRRAYQFLRALDFNAVAIAADDHAEPTPCRTVRFTGLSSRWETILNALAQPEAHQKADAWYDWVSSLRHTIEGQIQSGGIHVGELTERTRVVRAWLVFFSQRDHFNVYLAAVARAKPIIEHALRPSGRFRPPAVIHFRCTRDLYQLRGDRNGTRVVLPTPMITFGEERLRLLAGAFGGDSAAKQALLDAMRGEEYQEVQAELDLLSGLEDQAAGVHHDLMAACGRVADRYFGDTTARPRLVWSRAFTSRLFGYYDRVRDTLMVSRTLDRPDVPGYVVDFVVYHELLHKNLGVDFRNGRLASHTPEFREEERRFECYPEAQAFLDSFVTRR